MPVEFEDNIKSYPSPQTQGVNPVKPSGMFGLAYRIGIKNRRQATISLVVLSIVMFVAGMALTGYYVFDIGKQATVDTRPKKIQTHMPRVPKI